MQRAKLFAYTCIYYVNSIQITWNLEDDIFKRILQDKQFHLQLKSEQKEIIQNVLERKDSMAVLSTGFGKSICVTFPPLILDKVRSYMQIISHDTLR
jgi:superfamily II DNA helicase RecQ